MRNLFLILTVAVAAPPLAAQTVPAAKVPSHCKPGADKARADATVGARKLTELPPAQEYKAVWRLDERGCTDPIVVRRGLGAPQR